MADPLSVLGSLLAVATAGIQSARSLKAAVSRYKTRDAALRRLLDEATDAERILIALSDILKADISQPAPDASITVAALLRGPVERCSDVCSQFESAMEQFSKKSKTDLLDWAKMEFMRGDINQFLDMIAGYKATISVGLGVLTMRTVTISQRALEEYDQLVKDTIYDLQLQLQRIDDKVSRLTPLGRVGDSSSSIDLRNEREVTEQCLRICQDAKSYFESLEKKDAEVLQGTVEGASGIDIEDTFEAQLLTRRTINDTQRGLAETIAQLGKRLDSVLLNNNSSERTRLQQDIQMSTQCIELCNMASKEVNNQRIHIIGDVTTDGESDHIVVTTLADLFKVGKTVSTNRSRALLGSMSDEALIKVSHDHHHSRGGTAHMDDRITQSDSAAPAAMVGATIVNPVPSRHGNQTQRPHRKATPPTSNETRRRLS